MVLISYIALGLSEKPAGSTNKENNDKVESTWFVSIKLYQLVALHQGWAWLFYFHLLVTIDYTTLESWCLQDRTIIDKHPMAMRKRFYI